MHRHPNPRHDNDNDNDNTGYIPPIDHAVDNVLPVPTIPIMTDLAPGQRIVLSDGRHATVRFVGQAAFAAGDWVGIELDESSGKNDGSVQGDRYFDCPMGRGMFVRPAAVTITAPAPAPAPRSAAVAAKRVSRPSSILGRAAGPADSGLSKRMSLNAPSPTPGPKSRPSSVIRVSLSLFVPSVSDAAVRTDTAPPLPLSVSDKIPHQTAGNSTVERSPLSHRHPFECQTKVPPFDQRFSHIHGSTTATGRQIGACGTAGLGSLYELGKAQFDGAGEDNERSSVDRRETGSGPSRVCEKPVLRLPRFVVRYRALGESWG